ncbi:hypothetical protein T492DRAFT_1145048 [Pavlovales sp. CCMP2436]|nr:hypothetical protein T492DRAFT_1145048 [Pavlovales sp. CCMP2436]
MPMHHQWSPDEVRRPSRVELMAHSVKMGLVRPCWDQRDPTTTISAHICLDEGALRWDVCQRVGASVRETRVTAPARHIHACDLAIQAIGPHGPSLVLTIELTSGVEFETRAYDSYGEMGSREERRLFGLRPSRSVRLLVACYALEDTTPLVKTLFPRARVPSLPFVYPPSFASELDDQDSECRSERSLPRESVSGESPVRFTRSLSRWPPPFAAHGALSIATVLDDGLASEWGEPFSPIGLRCTPPSAIAPTADADDGALVVSCSPGASSLFGLLSPGGRAQPRSSQPAWYPRSGVGVVERVGALVQRALTPKPASKPGSSGSPADRLAPPAPPLRHSQPRRRLGASMSAAGLVKAAGHSADGAHDGSISPVRAGRVGREGADGGEERSHLYNGYLYNGHPPPPALPSPSPSCISPTSSPISAMRLGSSPHRGAPSPLGAQASAPALLQAETRGLGWARRRGRGLPLQLLRAAWSRSGCIVGPWESSPDPLALAAQQAEGDLLRPIGCPLGRVDSERSLGQSGDARRPRGSHGQQGDLPRQPGDAFGQAHASVGQMGESGRSLGSADEPQSLALNLTVLPRWVKVVPPQFYTPSLRRRIEAVVTLWSAVSILWAMWQLYRNLPLLHELLAPFVRVLNRYLDALLSRLNAALHQRVNAIKAFFSKNAKRVVDGVLRLFSVLTLKRFKRVDSQQQQQRGWQRLSPAAKAAALAGGKGGRAWREDSGGREEGPPGSASPAPMRRSRSAAASRVRAEGSGDARTPDSAAGPARRFASPVAPSSELRRRGVSSAGRTDAFKTSSWSSPVAAQRGGAIPPSMSQPSLPVASAHRQDAQRAARGAGLAAAAR